MTTNFYRALFPRFSKTKRQRGLLLASSSAVASGAFTVPTTPTSSTATKVPLNPNFTAGPTGLDPYRPLRWLIVDGEFFVTNGWDAPRRWDRANNAWAYMGSAAPTDFTGLSLTGAPGTAIPNNQTARYYLVGYDSVLDKETAPQGGADVTILNNAGATRDIVIPWTAGSLPVQYDKRRIYRALYQTDDYHLIATVTDATATYTDTKPDSTLRTDGSASWDGTICTTLPPAWVDFYEADGLIYLWQRNTNFVWYSRGVRVVGTYIADDVETTALFAVGADDSTGGPRAMQAFQGTKIIWKDLSIYELTGSDPTTFSCDSITASRGTFNRDTVLKVGRDFICFDKKGCYRLSPSLLVYSNEESRRVAEQPFLDRLNLSAYDVFHGVHLPASGVVVFWVALDYEPSPNVGLMYDDKSLAFLGIVTRRNPTATGWLADSQGLVHPCFGDDMGFLWEDLNAQSEGVYAGDNTAAVTGVSGFVVTAPAATFGTTVAAGAPGTPMDRYTSAGVVVDENRVYSATSTSLTTYYYPTIAYATGNTVAIGVIPAIYESPMFTFDTHEEKYVRDIFLEYESGVSGSIRLDTALDDESWTLKWEQSLATGASRAIVPTANVTARQRDEAFLWRLRISQRYANLGFSVRAIHVHYDEELGRRK